MCSLQERGNEIIGAPVSDLALGMAQKMLRQRLDRYSIYLRGSLACSQAYPCKLKLGNEATSVGMIGTWSDTIQPCTHH